MDKKEIHILLMMGYAIMLGAIVGFYIGISGCYNDCNKQCNELLQENTMGYTYSSWPSSLTSLIQPWNLTYNSSYLPLD